tara:strand:- start:1695 stop:2090 length:396 start_codon:yes stop_codon:yes gene_type:complete
MNGIGPQLPLSRDHRFGNYTLITSYAEEVKQNFRNLLLTSPGERIMNPDFGVGLRRYLFEPRSHSSGQIRQRIESQVRKYMPFIKINKLLFDNNKTPDTLQDSQMLSILIEYDVPSLKLTTSIMLQSGDVN